MLSKIELHDSYLLSLDSDRGEMEINAWTYRRNPTNGAGECGWQKVRITLQDFVMSGDVGILPFDIYSDQLQHNGEQSNELLTIPGELNGNFVVTLAERDGREVMFSGSNLQIVPLGPFEYIEESDFFDLH